MSDLICRSVVLCDEVRQEKSEKYLLVGVYPGGVHFGKLPGQVNLSLFLSLFLPSTGEHELEIHVEAGPNIHKLTMGLVINDASECVGIPTPPFPIAVAEPTELIVKLKLDQSEPLEVARYPIKENPNAWTLFPTEPPPPSEQSESDVQG